MNKLPNGWEYKKLKYIGKAYTGMTPSTLDKENFGDEHLFVTSADIKENKYIFNSIRKLSNKGFEKSRKFKKGDILYVCIGSIGKIALAGCDFTCNQQINVLRVNEGIDNEFVYYQLINSFPYISKFVSSGVVPIMNKTTFENISIAIPPLEEQKRIASALSKIDAYLENTIKLIEEKERFKKGIAKKLLTCKEGENVPEMRFKEFNDKWETVKLGDILLYEQPKDYIVKSEQYNNKYKYPVLTAGKSFILGYTNEEFGIYNKLPVIIFDDFTTDAKYVDFPFKVKSSAIKILKSKYYNAKLIYELMKNIKFNARTHKRYYLSEYQHLKIKIPKSIKEQEYISNFLSLLDAEIDNLKEQKEEIKKMKSGIIKKLMSGEVRL